MEEGDAGEGVLLRIPERGAEGALFLEGGDVLVLVLLLLMEERGVEEESDYTSSSAQGS